jgi:hypothetical protein
MVSPDSSVRGNTAYDPVFQTQQQGQLQHQTHDQWQEEVQNMSVEASEISQRLVTIRTQLVTISDKTSVAPGAVGSDVTDEEMQMAIEAQRIMKRLGEIKAKLSRKKNNRQSNLSRDSSLGVDSSVGEGGHGRFPTGGSFSTWNRPSSVLPSAVSLGTTPCMSSSFSTYPGYLNVTALSSESYSSLQAIREGIPRTLERQNHEITSYLGTEEREAPPMKSAFMEHTPSIFVETPTVKENSTEFSGGHFLFHKADALPRAMNHIRGTDAHVTDEDKVFSLFERPNVTPWALGTPGRFDHGIGVIVKPLRSVPTLEPIASFDDSSSSELSPIPTTDDTSMNAFDYPLTKQPGNAGRVGTPSLLDDTMMDTSSIEDSLEATEQGVLGVVGKKDKNAKSSRDCVASPSSSYQHGSIMDFFACGSHDGSTAADSFFFKGKVRDGQTRCCIEKDVCDIAPGRKSYSVMAFLHCFKTNGRWSG